MGAVRSIEHLPSMSEGGDQSQHGIRLVWWPRSVIPALGK